MLVLETKSCSKKIIPTIWFDYNDSQKPSPKWNTFNVSQYYEQIVPKCPIIKYLNEMGTEVEHVTVKQKAQFAIESNENSLLAVILFFLFVGYAILDSLIINEIYAQTPPYGIYIWGGFIVAFLVNVWLIIG